MTSRRDFIRSSAAVVALGATACGGGGGGAGSTNNDEANDIIMSGVSSTDTPQPDLPPAPVELHLLKRATWGPTPQSMQAVAEAGANAWLEQQLSMSAARDADVEAEVNFRWPTVNYDGCRLAQLNDDRRAMRELRSATLFRRVFSRRQLFEVMVDFWSDHFTIYHGDGIARHMKTVDDRDVIRANALGSFRSLLNASAKSPAMLEYLDNRRSTKKHPNENYARELMELHTLGVGGGYTEDDIWEVARAFTGWGIQTGGDDRLCLANNHHGFLFDDEQHDSNEKRVLGHTLPAGRGMEDGEQVLDILVAHPSTRRFIASKLYRRFVRDSAAPEAFISSVAAAWGEHGDIPAMLRAVFSSEEFHNAADAKLTRPQESAIALVRALEPEMNDSLTLSDLLRASAIPDLYSMLGLANIDALPELDFGLLAPLDIDLNPTYEGPNSDSMISRTGHVPFQWPSPDGYPDSEGYWASVNGLLERWRHVISVAGQSRSEGVSNAAWAADQQEEPGEALAAMRRKLLMRDIDDATASRLLAAAQTHASGERAASTEQFWRRLMALLLISPYAQRR